MTCCRPIWICTHTAPGGCWTGTTAAWEYLQRYRNGHQMWVKCTFKENCQFCSHWLAQCHVLCRFCVFKKFKRTTFMNTCIRSCLGWVGHPWQRNSHVGVHHEKDCQCILFLSLTQATTVCTSGEQGPRQMGVLPAIMLVASLKCPSLHWSSTGLRRSYWTGTTWPLCCCFGLSPLEGWAQRPWARSFVWSTHICSSTPEEVMWSWLS